MKKKVSNIDYSKAMLPRTRKAQFLDVFKMNYMVLLKCGLMTFLFFVPLIGFSFFMDFFYVSLIEHSTEEVEQTKMLFHYFLNIGLIIFSLVALIGLTGSIHVIRNLIWGEGIFFKDDFVKGIKENIGKNLIFGAIFALLYALAFFVFSLFPETIIAYFALIMFSLIFLPIFFWIILLNNTYNSKFGGLLKNGLFFYVKTIGWSIVGILMTLILLGLLLIPINLIWLKYIILTVYVIFVYPIVLLIFVLYSTSKFDAYINKDNYQDYYCRGLNVD